MPYQADSRAKELIKQSTRLHEKRGSLLSMWQAIAENFYLERANFTTSLCDGESFAEHLFGSYPVFARRELGNLFAQMLRPRSLRWFGLHVTDEDLDENPTVRQFLEYLDGVQWRAMYDPDAQMVNATKMADHDFAAFGNAVLEVTANQRRDALLYRNRHLRDCAWSENADGVVDMMYVNWEPTARQLVGTYGDNVSKATKEKAEKDPESTVKCCRISVPDSTYRIEAKPGSRRRNALPYTVLVVEKEAEYVLEETPERWFRFVVPRWQLVSGSQYARSPATEIVLPDARTFQVVIRTLREAGEMHVNPPMVGSMNAIREDAQLYPGGLTMTDIEYEGKLADAIAPIDGNPGTMPVGFEIAAALRDDIRLGFFLDKIKLPEVSARNMTAYEVQKRLEEHIRSASPLFEPIEDEYNARLCNLSFQMLKEFGAFGRPEDIPQELQGATVEFKLRSPLRDVQDQAKAGMFTDMLERIIGPASTIDPSQTANIDWTEAVRDSIRGLGAPAKWLAKEEAVAEAKAQLEKQQEMQAGLAALEQGGTAADKIGSAVQKVAPMVQQ